MKFTLFGILLLSYIAVYSQKQEDIPAFGKVDKSELDMKSCDFDKNAEAVVLFDEEKVVCTFYSNSYLFSTKAERHVRIKILNDKGLDEANIKISYYSKEGSERINDIQAQTYNLDADGKVVATPLDKKAIYTKAVSKRRSEKAFSLPGVKAGSVIEYSYLDEGDLSVAVRPWYFQRSIPVKLSKYSLDIPADIEVYCDPVCTLPVQRNIKNDHSISVKTFAMTDIPALRDEPFISCEDDYLQRIEPQVIAFNEGIHRIPLTDTWTNIVHGLMADEDFGQQLTKTIPRTDDLNKKLQGVTDPYTKMTTIFRYVRDHMDWNGYENIWALNGVKAAWKDKKGTSGEINLILLNLLKDAGLDAHAILVSTVDNGIIDQRWPSYGAFNKVMAYLVVGKKTYVLDATDKYASPDLIPWEVMASRALLITSEKNGGDWDWQDIWNPDEKFADVVVVESTIDAKGNMSGDAVVNSYDYSRSERLPALKKDKNKFIERYLVPQGSAVRIDSFTVENDSTDSLPLMQSFKFKQTLSSSGGYTYFTPNLFAGLDKNPFTADSRFSDVFFGASREYSIMGDFTIPEGYSWEELPKNLRMRLPDTSVVFTRICKADGKDLSVAMSLEFKKPIFSVEEYGNFREFYKKLFALLNEQIIFKKDAAASTQKN